MLFMCLLRDTLWLCLWDKRKQKVFIQRTVNLRGGANRIALLSIAVGLPNGGPRFEAWATGIVGSVALHGLDGGNKDLSRQKWTYQVRCVEEEPLTWYKAYLDTPRGNDPLALDLKSMGKGQAWINGQSVGRYWMAFAKGNCGSCNYVGTYRQTKCQSGCGVPNTNTKMVSCSTFVVEAKRKLVSTL